MYNRTTLSFTLGNASSEPFAWIVEGLDRSDCETLADEEIYAWVDRIIDDAITDGDLSIEQRASELNYPVYGYSTAQQFQDEDEYIAFKKQELRDDLAAERDVVFRFIKDWIATPEQ